jgi:hypothetical protein
MIIDEQLINSSIHQILMESGDDFFGQSQHHNLEPKMVQMFGGKVILRNGNEIIISAYVTNFLDIVKTSEDFLMDNVQRKIDYERVEKMCGIQEKEFQQRGRYGIALTLITLGQCSALISKNNLFGLKITDGQHRVCVWESLRKYQKETLISLEIMFKICRYEHYTQMIDDFQIINDQWVPVSQYYLKVKIRDVADGVIAWISETVDQSLIKPSKNALQPHLNLDRIREHMSSNVRVSDKINQFGGDTGKTVRFICNKIWQYNTSLKRKSVVDFREKRSDCLRKLEKRLDKCRSVNPRILLGMEKNYVWIDHALDPKVNIPDEDEDDEDDDDEVCEDEDDDDEVCEDEDDDDEVCEDEDDKD